MVQWMQENQYLVQIKGKYRVTAKFNKEITGQEVGIVKVGEALLVQEKEPLILATVSLGAQTTNWSDYYLQFIREAEVPARCEGKDGNYDVNKYSEEGMKAFRKALEKEGINYQLLVNVTRLYYKSHRQFALKIGNYMAKGEWRSDYESAFTANKEGKLAEHIQQEIQNDREFTTVRAADLGITAPGFGTQHLLGK
jgi:hypothetical protein